MSRIGHSWALAKTSWRVLRSDKTLAAIPAVSIVASLVAFGVLGGLFLAVGIGSGDNTAVEPAGWVLAVVAYLVFAFITVYFQSALVSGANAALGGSRLTFGESMSAATAKLHRILPWAIVTATVSVIISQLERQGWVGAIVGSVLGMAWNVVTFLTIPIIMFEDVGPVSALKRSGQLFKRTWGENLVAQVGFGLFGFIAAIPGLLVGGLGIATGNAVGIAVGITIAVVWIAIVSVVIAALSGIYRTALYRYAVEGQAPAAFAGADLSHAFAPKRGRFN